MSCCCVLATSLVDEGWYQLTAFLNFNDFSRPKTNSNFKLHTKFWGFGADKAFVPIGQASKFKVESKYVPLTVIWHSLPKAIPVLL